MKLLLIFILIFFISFIIYSFKIIKDIIIDCNINIKKYWYVLLIIIFIIFILLKIFNLYNIFFLIIIHFIIISMFIDIIYLIIKQFNNKEIFNKIHKTYLIPFLITLIIMIYGFINMNNVIETKYTLFTNKDIKDTRILLIGDVHYGNLLKKDKLDKIKKNFDKVNADIVIFIGDIVDEYTSKKDMEYVFKLFGSIKNKDGLYYVYGNHDKQKYLNNPLYTLNELNNTIINNNINILKDNYIKLNSNIVLLGREEYDLSRLNINNILNNKVSEENYIITLDHQPVNYKENDDNNIDLILSGHTHAGQLFPIKYLIELFNTADSSYGYKKYKNMDTIVTSGLSGWNFPIRTSYHSEYVVIDIKMTK